MSVIALSSLSSQPDGYCLQLTCIRVTAHGDGELRASEADPISGSNEYYSGSRYRLPI